MANAFSRTTRSLDVARADRWTRTLLVALVLLGAWLAWFALGRVTVYEVSGDARLEVEAAAHPIMPAVEGRVVSSILSLGRQVRRGDVLVELEGDAETGSLAESRTRHAALLRRLAALREEIRAGEATLGVQRGARDVAVREARARAEEADLRAQAAERERDRAEQMLAGGALAAAEADRARTEAQARRATARALALEVGRLEADRRLEESERGAEVAELRRQAVEVEGEAQIEAARLRRLTYEAGRRSIRAPVDGRVAQAAELSPGTVVRAGETLGSLIPAGTLRVVAYFPVTALGRVRAGQTARVRLDGFPWTEYGRLRGRVAHVSAEPRDGRFRVELALERPRDTSIPLAHGLPGQVEVEVERLSPATLVLRAAGRGRASFPADTTRSASR